jgi:putative zincin peptidase
MTPTLPTAGDPAAPTPLGRLVARGIARERRAVIARALALGRVRQVAAVDLLAPQGMLALARASLWLLLAGGLGFGALESLALRWHGGAPLVSTFGEALGLFVVNLLLYIPMLPLHEAVHALVILALGGRPRFGARLPLALYCTAPGQLFTRDGYRAVAYAPLVALSLAGALVIWLAPLFGAYLLFALAGNVSGAVGDLAAIRALRTFPPDALIADNATGYTAYVVEPEQSG